MVRIAMPASYRNRRGDLRGYPRCRAGITTVRVPIKSTLPQCRRRYAHCCKTMPAGVRAALGRASADERGQPAGIRVRPRPIYPQRSHAQASKGGVDSTSTPPSSQRWRSYSSLCCKITYSSSSSTPLTLSRSDATHGITLTCGGSRSARRSSSGDQALGLSCLFAATTYGVSR